MSWPGFGRQTIDDSLTCRHLQSLSQCVWQWTATSSTASMARNSYILRPYLIHLSHAKELPVFLRSWITHQGLSPLALFVEKITSTHFIFFLFKNSLFFSLFTSSFPRIEQILLSDSIKEWRQKKNRGTGGEYEFFTSFFCLRFLLSMPWHNVHGCGKHGSHTPTEWSKEFGCNGKSSRLSLFVPSPSCST